MGGELVLDALGGQVLAFAYDDVLAPTGDADEALGVLHGEIAAAEETVGGERLVERSIEVADAELRAVGFDLAFDAGRDRPPVLVHQPGAGARHGAAVGAV